MTDHYELLGVGPDATKDEIKAAYRSEVEGADSSRRAQLNRAWNVLSDPIQRQRYDEQLGDGGDGGDAGVVLPASRATGARRGPESKALDADGSSSNGAGKNGSGGGGSGRGGGGGGDDGGSDDDVPMRGGRPIPQPTVVLPAGMHLASKRQRGYSITFDLSILAVVYVLFVSVLIPMVLKDQYPAKVDRIDAIADRVEKLDDQKSAAEDRADKANDRADAAKPNSDARATARDDADAAQKRADDLDDQITNLQDEATDIQGEMIGTTYLMLGLLLLISLLYLVPSTMMTGQTLGKKLRRVWLVRVDGSKVGFGGALAHSAVPVVIALGVPQIGPIVALGIVYWALRDRNGQGFHDKLARTLVVDSPPAPTTS